MKVRMRKVLLFHSVFHLVYDQQFIVMSDVEKSFKSSSAAGTNGCINLSCWCKWGWGQKLFANMCSGSCVRRARDNIACLRQTSVGRMLAKTNKLSIGLGRRYSVTMCKTSLIGMLIRRVWALRHQTSEQYSAIECTRTRVAESNIVAPAFQVDLASRLKNPTRVVNFLRNDSRCQRNVSAQSNFMPRCVHWAR